MVWKNPRNTKFSKIFWFILATASWRIALAPAAGESDARECLSECMTVNNGGSMIYGSGKMKTEARPIEKFNSVRVSLPATVLIEQQTGAERLSVTAEDNLLPLIDSEVKDGALRLSIATGKSFTGRIPTFQVIVSDLRELNVEGSGTVTASKLDGSALSLTVAGSGDIHLAGRSDDLTVAIYGSASVDAAELQATRAKVVVSGSGDVLVNARDKLDATIMGSGTVDYMGSPTLEEAIFGSGSIQEK